MPKKHKKPFSGKAKKEQLKQKRERNRKKNEYLDDEEIATIVQKFQPTSTTENDQEVDQERNRLRTLFAKESKETIVQRKKDSHRKIDRHFQEKNEYLYQLSGFADVSNQLPIPHRPNWHNHEDQLEIMENEVFNKWIQTISEEIETSNGVVNYFERNTQVWRQLWRTIEKSQIVLHLVDATCPLFFLNHRLLNYITVDQKKTAAILLTKVDLITKEKALEWQEYLTRTTQLPVILFSNKQEVQEDEARQKGREELLQKVCQIDPQSYLKYWQREQDNSEDDELTSHERNDFLMIGLVGEPNVGKSSFLNYFFPVHHKKVSESSTPGHTKHFQTLFYSSKKNIAFCDSPGIVFPRKTTFLGKQLQVIFGTYPIAQTREPYTAIRLVAEVCDPPLQEIYKLKPVEIEEEDKEEIDFEYNVERQKKKKHSSKKTELENKRTMTEAERNFEWTPYAIAEAYALKKQFHTKKGSLDVYRAANQMLRDIVNSKKIPLSFSPPAGSFIDIQEDNAE